MERGKKRQLILCAVMIALLCSLCLTFTYGFRATQVSAADTSIFTFVKTSDTECSVRLADRTVTRASVPMKAKINGVEYTVTSVVANGFSSSVNLEKVRLPITVTSIGNSAFSNCKKLKSITIPGVQSIGTSAFSTCSSLGYLIVPETIQLIAPTILRNTSTQVYVRVSQERTVELGWAANWNGSNANQNVEHGSSFVPEVEYIPYFSSSAARSASTRGITAEGYYVDGYQPFYGENIELAVTDIYIPSTYTDNETQTTLPVIGISANAFNYNEVKSMTIDYAETPINILSSAFQ